jgi:hypothetical protein
MKRLITVTLAALVIVAALSFVSAQQPPPPPPLSPDYIPNAWKEYSFTDDNIRFRFPVHPTRVESTMGQEKHPSSSYTRDSFLYFSLIVTSHPAGVGGGVDEKVKIDAGMNRMLGGIKSREPKMLAQQDVSVDGHPCKFLKIETNDGLILRIKFFSAQNRLYIGQVVTRKGARHGVNWENDFEIPAMGFLDSLHLIEPAKTVR